jgi:hypothetical protein
MSLDFPFVRLFGVRRKRQDKQTVNQRREDNVMAKRQDKQTVNQRREDNAMSKRQDKQTINFVLPFSHCIVFSSLIDGLFVLSFSHYIVFSSLIYGLFVLTNCKSKKRRQCNV